MDGSITIAVAFAAGLLSFLSPCVLPIVPGYLGFITGMSLDDLRSGHQPRAVLVPALFFILGFSAVFLLLGASATLLGQALLRYKEWIARIGGVLIILLGLHLLGTFRLQALMRERRVHLARTPAGRVGSFVAGLAFAAGWTPCLGPVLAALITYGMARETLGGGMLLMGAYGLGLAVPFALAAVATSHFLNVSQRFRHMVPVAEKISGVVLIVMGVLLISGSFTVLSGWFIRFTPQFLLERL